MDTSTSPRRRSALTEPIDLGSVPPKVEPIAASATGELTLRGATKSVTFDVRPG